ncbi:hypothetical protein CEUSTIGMA_g9766.t1 [Chlamydomonas eustigma]|uniref:Disease resistance R13L4/SHOC-2-like LRR domain-containing protein n=1 Tax=Chlamydomonas eustigma TaxID=1157962 RepID=A0A250XGY2_9CHLO|nr:hypothetical protein CEUSTIGMA_g9766.t1 [Chlamydomonas eustigma]|eukprot:GAX82337.1 hypothetical protein CEUSTIGMA_g9766.t1 [Chlamydomonas eustigma]
MQQHTNDLRAFKELPEELSLKIVTESNLSADKVAALNKLHLSLVLSAGVNLKLDLEPADERWAQRWSQLLRPASDLKLSLVKQYQGEAEAACQQPLKSLLMNHLFPEPHLGVAAFTIQADGWADNVNLSSDPQNDTALLQLLPNLQELIIQGADVDLGALSWLPKTLQRLMFTNCSFTVNAALDLSKELSKASLLQHFVLSYLKCEHSGVQMMLREIRNLTGLRHLSLDGSLRGIVISDHMPSVLSALTALTHLDLGGNRLEDLDIVSCASSLSRLTDLKHLDLCENFICSFGMDSLATTLTSLMGLEYLDLARNMLVSEAAATLATALTALTSLTFLDLSNNSIQDAGVTALVESFSHLKRLRHLDLSWTEITGLSMVSAQEQWEHLSHLQTLRLQHNDLRDEGAVALSEAIRVESLGELLELSVGGNSVGDDGGRALFAQLSKLKKLRGLKLMYFGVLEEETKLVMADAVVKLCPSLTALDLCGMELSPENAFILMSGLRKSTGMVNLDLRSTALGDLGAVFLTPVIAQMTGLHSLDLAGNQIGGAGLYSLSPSLKALTELRMFMFSDNSLKAGDLDVVVDILSAMSSLQFVILSTDSLKTESALWEEKLKKLPSLQHCRIKV